MDTIMDTIIEQFSNSLKRGIEPYIEYRVDEDKWIAVKVEIVEQGVQFSFNTNGKPCYFDGDIITVNENCFVVPFDESKTKLHDYLQRIGANMLDGYLFPNNMFYVEF